MNDLKQELLNLSELIEDQAPPKIYERGETLLFEEKVLNPRISIEEKTIRAEVSSSNTIPYSVSIHFEEGPLSAECDCDFHFTTPHIPCKHITALSLWATRIGRVMLERDDLEREAKIVPKTVKRKI